MLWALRRLTTFFGGGKNSERNIEEQSQLISLDLKLLKINGLNVPQQIRTDPLTESTPVFIITSSREEADIVSSYRPDANSYLSKPLEFANFTKNSAKTWSILAGN